MSLAGSCGRFLQKVGLLRNPRVHLLVTSILSDVNLVDVFSIPALAIKEGTANVCAQHSQHTPKNVMPREYRWSGVNKIYAVRSSGIDAKICILSLWNYFCVFAAVQCEPGTTYSACISSCPTPSCNNLGMLDSMLEECRELPCVEGITICTISKQFRYVQIVKFNTSHFIYRLSASNLPTGESLTKRYQPWMRRPSNLRLYEPQWSTC